MTDTKKTFQRKIEIHLRRWVFKNNQNMKNLMKFLGLVLVVIVLFRMFIQESETTDIPSVEIPEKKENPLLYQGYKPEHNIQALQDMIYPFKEDIAQDVKVHIVNKYIVESAEHYLGSFVDYFVYTATLDSNLYYFIREIDAEKYDTNVTYQQLIKNKIFNFNFK